MITEYKLKTPIILGEETVEVLKLEEPDQNRLEAYDVGFGPEDLTKTAGLKKVLCACAVNVNEAHVSKMKGGDFKKAAEKCVIDFFA